MIGLKLFLADCLADIITRLKFTPRRSIFVDRLLIWKEARHAV